MIYDWRNIEDLRKVSIFDLTDDIEIIRKCTCLGDEISMDKREWYEKELDNGNFSRVDDFEAFNVRALRGDEDFVQAIREAFPEEYKEIELSEGVGWE